MALLAWAEKYLITCVGSLWCNCKGKKGLIELFKDEGITWVVSSGWIRLCRKKDSITYVGPSCSQKGLIGICRLKNDPITYVVAVCFSKSLKWPNKAKQKKIQ